MNKADYDLLTERLFTVYQATQRIENGLDDLLRRSCCDLSDIRSGIDDINEKSDIALSILNDLPQESQQAQGEGLSFLGGKEDQ